MTDTQKLVPELRKSARRKSSKPSETLDWMAADALERQAAHITELEGRLSDADARVKEAVERERERCLRVQLATSETFSYQMAGYGDGWHAAIKGYRAAIRNEGTKL